MRFAFANLPLKVVADLAGQPSFVANFLPSVFHIPEVSTVVLAFPRKCYLGFASQT